MIDNERTKLLANALDRASTACLTVGIITPLAGFIYGVMDLAPVLQQKWPIVAVFVWLALAIALHCWARRVLKGLKS